MPLVYSNGYEDLISAEALIVEGSTPLPDLQNSFLAYCKAEGLDGNIGDDADFMESIGYTKVISDNTYNYESDLDNYIVVRVFKHHNHKTSEPIFATDKKIAGMPALVTTLALCLASDPRGAYDEPRFVVGNFGDGEYSAPIRKSLSYEFTAKRKGDKKAEAEATEINNRGEYDASFGGEPYYRMTKDFPKVERNAKGKITVTTNSGAKLIAHPSFIP
jgi:hypothetical protein